MQSSQDSVLNNTPLIKKSFVNDLFPAGKIPASWLWYLLINIIVVSAVTLTLAFSWNSLSYARLLNFANPAILGTLSLLLGLLTRNAGISDRIRALGGEVNSAIVDKTPPSQIKERLDSVAKQLKDFRARYLLNVFALILVALNVILLPVFIFTFPYVSTSNTDKELLAVIIKAPTFLVLLLSSWLFVSAAVSGIIDIALSIVTIEEDWLHSLSTIRNLQESPDEIDDQSSDVVVHFSLLFHRLWYDERLVALKEWKRDGSSVAIDDFLCKYIGLHLEELHFFRHGLLPKTLYREWLSFLRCQAVTLHSDPSKAPPGLSLGDKSIVKWWNENSAGYPHELFKKVLDRVFQIENLETADKTSTYSIDEIVEFILLHSRK